MKIGFVGGGTMAEAMIAGLLKQGTAPAKAITASDVLPVRREHLHNTYGVVAVDQNRQAAAGADLVVLAVKPQQLGEVLADLRGALTKEQAVLSIVAGAPLRAITSGLAHEAVIRAMPNTPGQLGVGITAWTATPQVDDAHRQLARRVLPALGQEVYVADEKLIDVATALSGSGPAYVFLFIEALTDAGVHLGMARDLAQKLAVQTVIGSGTMAAKPGAQPAALRNQVTSPGGTTAAALLAFEESGFRAAVMKAVIAAYERCVELGKESGK